MKKIILSALVIVASGFAQVKAQDRPNDGKTPEEFMKEMVSKQADKLAEDMKLESDKATEFKTLFTEYKTQEMSARMPKAQNGDKKKEGGKKAKRGELTDAQADSLATANFETQEKELQLRKDYYAKFKSLVGAANAYKVVMARQQGPRGNQQGRQGGPDGGFGGGRPGGGNFGMPGGGGGDF